MSSAPEVLLVTNYRPDGQYSMLRFSSLLKEHGQKEGICFRETNPLPKLNRKHAPKKLKKWLGYADKYLLFPRKLATETKRLTAESPGRALLHVVDHSNSPYLRKNRGRLPTLLTCHDLIAVQSALNEFPGIRLSSTGKVLQRQIRSSIPLADHVACDSHSTEAQLHRIRPDVSDRSSTIHLGLASQAATPRPLDNPPFPPESTKFVLHVGNAAWYKNRKAAIKGFLLASERNPDENRQLLLVGPPPSKEETCEISSSSLLRFQDRIHVRPNVDDSELNHLYEHAEALLFPSLLEGFGWPPLEAQTRGCPVIASQAGSLKEVLEESCLVVVPERPEQIAEALHRLSEEPELSIRLKDKGRRNAARFPFEQTAQAYASTYRNLLAEKN